LNHSGRQRSVTIWKCTVEPPTARPELLGPKVTASGPALIRSPRQ
jgi:hypothetical protein